MVRQRSSVAKARTAWPSIPGQGRWFGAGDSCTALVWDLSDLAEEKGRAALKAEQLQTLWADLKGDDRLKAYDALCRLRHSPVQAVGLLRKQLRPVAPGEPRRLAGLIAALDSDQFESRERAARELSELGYGAEEALRQALKNRPSAETRRRIKGLLERIALSREGERTRWALRLLELLGTPAARRLLEALSKGDPDSWQSKEANVCLERLKARITAPR